jgi:hypothetical protein
MTLSGTDTVYYVVTAINGNAESLSNTIPAAATAHAFEFGKVTSSTGPKHHYHQLYLKVSNHKNLVDQLW